MGRIKIVSAFLFVVLFFTCGCINLPDNTPYDNNLDEISVACWNLQIFGTTKANKPDLIEFYGDTLDDYDIFIVQEIRDISGTAIQILADEFPNHVYILSDRAGQSSSKEQYAVFYNNEVELISYKDWANVYQDEMQRPPFEVTFKSTQGIWDFTVFTIHTSPSTVSDDLEITEDIIGSTTQDTILIGDLNADGNYYNEENIQHFETWDWVIHNNVDTTVASSDNTYDRIIINDACENNYLTYGIIDDVTEEQSDHYLIYGVFNPMVE